MELYYDIYSGMFTLVLQEGSMFLGPMTQSLIKLQEYGYSPSQSREAVLQAFFNAGAPVDLHMIQKIARENNEDVNWTQFEECS